MLLESIVYRIKDYGEDYFKICCAYFIIKIGLSPRGPSCILAIATGKRDLKLELGMPCIFNLFSFINAYINLFGFINTRVYSEIILIGIDFPFVHIVFGNLAIVSDTIRT